jgi:Clp amino terminal domain, pathogenicity island component
MTWWLRLYPTRWRERYGEEFAALIQDRGWSLDTGYDVLRSVLDAWLHPDLVDASGALQPATVARARGGRFDKFTQRSRTALDLAHREAIRLGSVQIGTEHLLLGLLEEGNGVAAHVLMHHGIELAELRAAVLGRLQPAGETAARPIGLSLLAKRAIELSVAEANRLNHHYVGTEHLLLGLVAQAEGIAAEELRRRAFGDLSALRREILQVLMQGGPHLRPPM